MWRVKELAVIVALITLVTLVALVMLVALVSLVCNAGVRARIPVASAKVSTSIDQCGRDLLFPHEYAAVRNHCRHASDSAGGQCSQHPRVPHVAVADRFNCDVHRLRLQLALLIADEL